jgi:Na+/proline symporter
MLVSYLAGKDKTDNETFFSANRSSVWWAVAVGMVGSSMSGVSFVSVPGMVRQLDFTYLQFVLGFVAGYFIVAQVLLPLYYRLNLSSIYTYLGERFGRTSHKTGTWFFLVGKMIGSAAKLYVVALVLHTFIFVNWDIPFWLTVCATVFMIWLYTFRSGIKSIVWTDVLQTLVMFVTLVVIIFILIKNINLPLSELADNLIHSQKTRIFVFDDWKSTQNFFKQFFSGAFIVIVMTGLDQDQMQKNLTCKNLREAKRNMNWYGWAFVPINLLFLILGALLLMAYSTEIQSLKADNILPFITKNYLGNVAVVMFIIGITASALNSADSALTAITTSFAIDILQMDNKNDKKSEQKRQFIHAAVCILFVFVVLLFKYANNRSVIDALYTIVSYTYGPLLGMYAFGLCTTRTTNDKFVPFIAVFSPVFCYLLNRFSIAYYGYTFGYELLILNGLITFAGMWAARGKISGKSNVINHEEKE